MQNSSKNSTFPLKYIAIILLVVIGAPLAIGWLSPEEAQQNLAREGSWVEIGSAAAHFLGFGILCWTSIRAPRRFYLALVLLVFGFRELDFNARFFTMSVTKTRFFLSDEVPGVEKVLGVLLYTGLAILAYKLWVNFGRAFLARLRRRCVDALLVVGALGLGIGTKLILDGLPRKLSAFGVSVDFPSYKLGLIEENLELSMGILLLLAVILSITEDRRSLPDRKSDAGSTDAGETQTQDLPIHHPKTDNP